MKQQIKRQQERLVKGTAGFLKKINKIDKPLARLIKKRKDKYRNESGDITTKTTEI